MHDGEAVLMVASNNYIKYSYQKFYIAFREADILVVTIILNLLLSPLKNISLLPLNYLLARRQRSGFNGCIK